MTHDLVKSILEVTEVKVNKGEGSNLKSNTYYALIHISHEGKEMAIDARPSDALALSLTVGAPILVAKELINKGTQIDLEAEPEDKTEQGKRWQEILEKLKPKDFGNT